MKSVTLMTRTAVEYKPAHINGKLTNHRHSLRLLSSRPQRFTVMRVGLVFNVKAQLRATVEVLANDGCLWHWKVFNFLILLSRMALSYVSPTVINMNETDI